MLTPDRTNQAERDRGSVAVFTVVFAIAVIFLTALILDGGIAMNARERATDIAGQAARAAAGDIDVQQLEAGNKPVIGQNACALAADLVERYATTGSSGIDKVDSVTMQGCSATPGSTQATVVVQVTTQPLVGILGGFTETGTDSAFTECGINAGGEC